MTQQSETPLQYKQEYVKHVTFMCKLGASDAQIADFFNVSESTIEVWKVEHYEFASVFHNRENLRALRLQEKEAYLSKRRPSKAKYNNKYIKNRRAVDIKFKLTTNFSANLRHHLKSKNRRHVFDILGYSVDDLISHIETLFKPGMNWENYGSHWHIDHKRPVSWFNYATTYDEQFKECWALRNLQPLEAAINLSKQDRYEHA